MGNEFDRPRHRSNPDCCLNSPNEEAVCKPVNEIYALETKLEHRVFPRSRSESSSKRQRRPVIAQQATMRPRGIRMAKKRLRMISLRDVRRSNVVGMPQ